KHSASLGVLRPDPPASEGCGRHGKQRWPFVAPNEKAAWANVDLFRCSFLRSRGSSTPFFGVFQKFYQLFAGQGIMTSHIVSVSGANEGRTFLLPTSLHPVFSHGGMRIG